MLFYDGAFPIRLRILRWSIICLITYDNFNDVALSVMFVMVPNSRINSWESWFIFNLQKNNTNQYCNIQTYKHNNQRQHNQAWVIYCGQLMAIFSLTQLCNHKFCTYLNGYLLEAPREYARHGLIPGWDWTSCWLSSTCILLFWPTQYLAVCSNNSCFTHVPSLANQTAHH
jgi:hypothetical protein